MTTTTILNFPATRARTRRPAFGTKMTEQILEALDTFGGITCDEVECLIDGKHQTVSARFYDLHSAGVIVDSGEKRFTRSGRSATVWVRVKAS